MAVTLTTTSGQLQFAITARVHVHTQYDVIMISWHECLYHPLIMLLTVCVCVCCSGVQAGVRCVRSVLHGLDTMSSNEMVSTETGQSDITPAWWHISADNGVILTNHLGQCMTSDDESILM